MTDLEKVEELTKALQDGKTLVNGEISVKITNGFLTLISSHDRPFVKVTINFSDDWQIQEPEKVEELNK